MQRFEEMLTPRDVAFLLCPKHRRPEDPRDLPRWQVERARILMGSGAIKSGDEGVSTYKILRTTPTAVADYQYAIMNGRIPGVLRTGKRSAKGHTKEAQEEEGEDNVFPLDMSLEDFDKVRGKAA